MSNPNRDLPPTSSSPIAQLSGPPAITASTLTKLKSGEEKRYAKYACMGYRDGDCMNAFRVPEEWLRATVLDLVRQRLFYDGGPLPTAD